MSMRSCGFIALVLTLSSQGVAQPDSAKEDRSTFALQLNQDNTFNFAQGIFTNSRDQNVQGYPTLGDAIVPGITSFYKGERGEIEFFCAICQKEKNLIAFVEQP